MSIGVCMTKGYTTIERIDGHKEWWLNGKPHREDGPAIIKGSGTKSWWIKGKLHREDGPAIEYEDGHKEWFLHGQLHREGGPAVERADGSRAWFLNDKEYTKEEYYKELYKRGIISKEDYFLEFI